LFVWSTPTLLRSPLRQTMPLTMAQLEGIQADLMADDVEIDFEKMSLWTEKQAETYFESGGTVEPPPPSKLPPLAPKMPKVSDEIFNKWFPKRVKAGVPEYQQPPKFRIVCFHAAGTAETIWSGNGTRQPDPNPFVKHCKAAGGELLACEFPGREMRRNEPRSQKYGGYVEQLWPVLVPVLQDGIPYVIACHSMGTWFMYEFVKELVVKGIPLPEQLVISGFPGPDLPESERPWNKQRPMTDDQFKEECKGWDVNEIALVPANFKIYGPLMRDDFTLFDEYEYTPLPDAVAGGFPIPMEVTYAVKDKRIKKHHVERWAKFTSSTCNVYEGEGNHLFFYDVPARAKYMERVISKLPPAFQK